MKIYSVGKELTYSPQGRSKSRESCGDPNGPNSPKLFVTLKRNRGLVEEIASRSKRGTLVHIQEVKAKRECLYFMNNTKQQPSCTFLKERIHLPYLQPTSRYSKASSIVHRENKKRCSLVILIDIQ